MSGTKKTPRKTPRLSKFALTTLGVWRKDDAYMVADYYDATSVRISTEGRSRVLDEREWLAMYDNLRNAGYTRS